MRTVRTALVLLLVITAAACGPGGITGPETDRDPAPPAGAPDARLPEPAAPRLGGGYIGSGA